MSIWHAPHNFYHWFSLVALFTLVFGGVPTVWENVRASRNPIPDFCCCGFLALVSYVYWMHP